MGVAIGTKLLCGIVVVLALVVVYQLVGLGTQAEALSNVIPPLSDIRKALGERLLRQTSLKTAKPNMWIHLSAHGSLPFPTGTQLAVAPAWTTPIAQVPSVEQLCAYTTLYHNSTDFNVICIMDDDFPLLLPGWNVNLKALPEAPRSLVRQIALLRVAYYYGGMLVPSTFACTAPLSKAMQNLTALPKDHLMAFEAETSGYGGKQEEAGDTRFGPSARFMYSAPLNPTVRTLIDALSVKTGTQAQVSAFTDHASLLMNYLLRNGKVKMLPGELVGTRTAHGDPTTVVETLDGFDRAPDSVGVWIPARVFEVRKYGWLIRETPQKILSGSTWLASQLRRSLGLA